MERAAGKQKEPNYYNLRFERKFIFQRQYVEDIIETVIYANPFLFHEIFERRTVNNVYFDDNEHSFYKMNVSGDGLRDKYRLRWYGENFSRIENSTIEVKKKYGEVGDKYSFKIKGFTADLDYISLDQLNETIQTELKDPRLLLKFHGLFPTLLNSYERRYFLSNCGKFRITIDYNMSFYNPNCKQYKLTKSTLDDIILELKYSTENDIESREISQMFNNRLSKNSKYIRGYEIFNF